MNTKPSSQLTLVDYQERSAYTDQFKTDSEVINQLRYGFFGEVGGLLAAVKKAHRETISLSQRVSVQEEIGDALWYLVALVRRAELKFDDIGEAAILQLQHQLHVTETKRPSKDVLFREIDGLLAFQGKHIPQPNVMGSTLPTTAS